MRAVLMEPEPIVITVLEKGVDDDDRPIMIPTNEQLPGPYEIHDSAGISESELTAAGERAERRPLLIGMRHASLMTGVVITVGGTGPHAGFVYRLGPVNDLRTHIECTLEDV